MDKRIQENATKTATSQDAARILEVDFLKGVLILLMIGFHLAWIGDHYPFAKQVVYTFHMPVFLIISGYLMNVQRSSRPFMRSMCRFAIPYVVMESAYIIMAAYLPIREHIETLNIATFFKTLFLHPIGPYWYLHTLLLCSIIYFAVVRLTFLGLLSRLILLGLVYYGVATTTEVFSFTNAMYFLAGVVLRQSSTPFLRLFQPSSMAMLAVLTIIARSPHLQSSTTSGILLVFLTCSSLVFIFHLLGVEHSQTFLFLGHNTLPLLLFSPIFTFVCKLPQPYLLIEPTGMLFLACSLVICVMGSLIAGRVVDALLDGLPNKMRAYLPQMYNRMP